MNLRYRRKTERPSLTKRPTVKLERDLTATGPIAGNVIVYGDAAGNLFFLKSLDGSIISTQRLLFSKLTAPPLTANGYAIAGEGQTQGSTALHAFRLTNGTDAWSPGIQLSGSIDCTPLLIGTSLYVPTSAGVLFAYDISNIISPQSTSMTQLFTPSGTVTVGYVLQTAANALVVVTSQGLYGVRLGTQPSVVWSVTTGNYGAASPVLVGQMLYVANGSLAQAYNLSGLSGSATPAWSTQMPANVAAIFDAGFSQLLVSTTDGSISLVDAKHGGRLGAVSSASFASAPANLSLLGCDFLSPRPSRGGLAMTEFVFATSQTSYQQQWQAAGQATVAHPPVAALGSVYTVDANNTLYSFALSDGAQQWFNCLSGTAPTGRLALAVAPSAPANQVSVWSQPDYAGTMATVSANIPDLSSVSLADIGSVFLGGGSPYLMPYQQPSYVSPMPPLYKTTAGTMLPVGVASVGLYNLPRMATIATGVGIQMNVATDAQWISASAGPSMWFVTDITNQVIGLSIAMLDFDPAAITLANTIAPIVAIGGPGIPVPAGVEVAVAMAGSTAQGLIQPYPGDLDFMERINIQAATRAAALQQLGTLVRNRVLTSTSVAGIQTAFIEVKFGAYPFNFKPTGSSSTMSAGSPISWSFAQVQQGSMSGTNVNTGQPATILWTDVQSNPNWIKIDWIFCQASANIVLNTSIVLDPLWEAPDGTVVPLDLSEEAFLQEVYLGTTAQAVLQKLYMDAGPRLLQPYIDAMQSEVKKFTKPGPKQNYGKAAKRLYNLFRINGRLLDAAYLRDMFSGGYFQLYQIWSQLKGIGEAALETNLPRSVMQQQTSTMAQNVQSATYINSAQKQQILTPLNQVVSDLGQASLPASFAGDVAATQAQLMTLMNAQFSAQLAAVPAIGQYISTINPPPNALVEAVDDRFPF